MRCWKRALVTIGAVALSLPPAAVAAERVGVVTTVEGMATVARVALVRPREQRQRESTERGEWHLG